MSVRERALELAVIIPTYNERANVTPLLERLRKVLAGIEWEAVFVDDNSPDNTAGLVREIGRLDYRVRVLERIGRQGLASACIEGMLATAAPYLAVMDADLQHDETILPAMFERIRSENLDLVVATRKSAGGSMGEFSKERVALSGLGSRLSHAVCRCDLSDPMSGFFVVDRRFFESVAHRLSGIGFKILVDLVASSTRPVRFAEVPFRFRKREHGESKLDINVGLEYLQLLLDKAMGNLLPARFVLFLLVGAVGLLVHLSVLGVLLYEARLRFAVAQIAATIVAMTFNFLLNNVTTFRDRRLHGAKLITGLAIYYVACSIGAVTNLAFAQFLLNKGSPWYIAGLAGMSISSVWNYGVNTVFTWRRGMRATERRRLVALQRASLNT